MRIDSELMKQVENLPMEIKIGQLFFTSPTMTLLDGDFINSIKKYQYGNSVLFDNNIQTIGQVKSLIRDIKEFITETTGIEPLIAVDGENGITTKFLHGITLLPGNMAIGATRDPVLAYECGLLSGAELLESGFNMAWAPVLDLCSSKKNRLIEVRAFGKDPILTSELGISYIKGLHDGGVTAVCKHFPGLGLGSEGNADAHIDLFYNEKRVDELLQTDLLPFKNAIDNGVDGIMPGNVTLKTVDAKYPVSMSKKTLEGLLRQKLGFNGLVLCIGLQASMFATNLTYKKAGTNTFEAGCDMLMSESKEHQGLIYNSLLSMSAKKTSVEERINQSVYRIFQAKKKAKALAASSKSVSQMEKQNIAKTVNEKSITLICDPKNLIPLDRAKYRSLLVIEPESRVFAYADNSDQFECNLGFFISSEGFNVECVRTSLEISEGFITDITQRAKNHDLVVIGSINSHEFPGYLEMIRRLSLLKNIIIVSLRYPNEKKSIPESATIVSAFCLFDSSTEAAAGVISGRIMAQGVNPLQ